MSHMVIVLLLFGRKSGRFFLKLDRLWLLLAILRILEQVIRDVMVLHFHSLLNQAVVVSVRNF